MVEYQEADTSGFCNTPFWDLNKTWYTDDPDFTRCFEDTVITYIPLLYFVVTLPCQLYVSYNSRHRLIPWTLLNATKFLLIGLMMVLPFVDMILLSQAQEPPATSSYVAALVRFLTYAIVLLIQIINKKQGEVTSGFLLIGWVVAGFFGIINFRTLVRNQDPTQPFSTYTVEFPLVLAMFFLNLFADAKPKYVDMDEAEDPSPEVFASFASVLAFTWVDPMIIKGWKKLLKAEDLWPLPLEDSCKGLVPRWEKSWSKVLKDNPPESKKKVSVLTGLFYCFGVEFGWSALLQLVYSVMQFASPQIVNLLISFVEGDEPQWRGYFYLTILMLATFTNTVIAGQYYRIQYMVGFKLRTALTSAIYKKSMKLSNAARREMTVGETTNLMAIDTQKFMDLAPFLNQLWVSPLQVALALYFLWGVLGPSSLAGFAIMALMVPINIVISNKMKVYQISQMKDKDRRVKVMDEILNGIKVLKLYAWESSFMDNVKRIRDSEISALKKAAYMQAFTSFLWTCAPFLVSLCSFTVYIFIDPVNNILDAQTAFVSLTLFNLLRMPLNILPMVLVYCIQCAVSLKRIDKFMNAEELNPNNVTHEENCPNPIEIQNCNFSWNGDGRDDLQDINLNVEPGSLVAVVGPVGSGKSTLLSSMLGELSRTSGRANICGKLAYVPQQAWIQNATLQYNVTFGRKLNRDYYNKIVDACALRKDFEMLPGGDQIEIGEKGINLSGGQKQRVSVARSVYSNGSLYLLDDPLSAVDSHVGKHIFEHVIGPHGLLKHKTRVLVTHGVGFLPDVDKIVVMKDGRISETGTYTELLQKKGEFADFLVQYLSEKSEDVLDPETESELEELKQVLEVHLGKSDLDKKLEKAQMERASNASALTEIDKASVVSISENKEGIINEDLPLAIGQNLIEEETAEEGKIKNSVYSDYFQSCGILASIATVVFYSVYQAFSVGCNIWLSKWSDDPLATTDTSVRDKYLSVYGVLGIFQSIFILLGSGFLHVYTLDAASTLHNTMLVKILRCPMSFFDTTPVGRILNRFSKEIDIIDTTIPMNLRTTLNQFLNVIGTIAVVVFAMPIFLAVVIPIFIMFYYLQKGYLATARQVKRLEAITRSPIYNHFGETITGGPTIRAYKKINSFIVENEKRIDQNQLNYYPTVISARWVSNRLDAIGNIIVLFSALFAVMSKDSTDPGQVGLTLSYSLNITGALILLVRSLTEVETNLVSVERVKEYHEVPQEAAADIPENDPPKEWPQHGQVKFGNYQTRYREGLDLVLKGISCDILSGEKIGIVGRTGAGKSSLTLALFRIIEAAGGNITIDGVNISQLGLEKLRSRITIIPQDPVLFSGTMRMNLDPFDQYKDREIWWALEQANLKSTVASMQGGLQHILSEGGENLSVGQRQLVCLARALLRNTKVLVLDEATAAVDLETDDIVQATIRREFIDCTVITIAHRLNTILDSSRVMVLDAGQIVEFDSPQTLLANRKSVFYGMAKDAGLV